MIRRVTLVGVAVLTLAAGCVRTEAGQPSGTGGPTESSTPAVQTSGQAQPAAPRVSSPRDARNTAACDALSSDQLAQLGMRPERRQVDLPAPFSEGCQLASADRGWGVLFGFDTSRQGLSETYLRRDNYQHFEPRTIDGYPAVDAQTVFNAEDCYTYVGVADTQQLYINVDNRPTGQTVKPACERLDEIVKMIIGNLPPLK